MTIPPDARLEYLERVAAVILKFKPDKWGKMMGAEDNLALFTDFLEKADVSVLVLTLNPAGMIVPCLGFPAALKFKGVYFIKKRPETLKKDTYKDNLIYGDISPAPVDQLIVIVGEVGAPPAGGEGPAAPCWVGTVCARGDERAQRRGPEERRGEEGAALRPPPRPASSTASLSRARRPAGVPVAQLLSSLPSSSVTRGRTPAQGDLRAGPASPASGGGWGEAGGPPGEQGRLCSPARPP